jgi:putative ABC transport system permease protein
LFALAARPAQQVRHPARTRVARPALRARRGHGPGAGIVGQTAEREQSSVAERASAMMNASPALTWQLVMAVVALLAMGIAASRLGHIHVERDVATAGARAIAQLAVVALVIGAALERRWAAVLFAFVMFAVATATATGRIGARANVAWVAVALAGGAVPVLAVIFASRSVAFSGPAIVAIAGITIGGTMTAHTLAARRAFDVLRAERGQVEAALALGFDRSRAISLVIRRHAPEAVLPAIDQTRTVGLVTLPGAFVGVLLGGGSAADAAAAQVLVLVGLLAAETSVVVLTHHLIAAGRLLAADVRDALPMQ